MRPRWFASILSVRSLRFIAPSGACLPFLWACTAQEPDLATLGRACDYEPQCVRPLTCACVRYRQQEDGPDQVLQHGTCQRVGYRCPVDAGASDGAGDGDRDGSSDGGRDVGGEATTDSSADDAGGADGRERGDAARASDAPDALGAADATMSDG